MTRLSEIEKTDGLKKHELLQAWGTDRGSKGTYPSLHWVRYIEQLEGRAQTLEGALREAIRLAEQAGLVVELDVFTGMPVRFTPRGEYYQKKESQAALAATGEEGTTQS